MQYQVRILSTHVCSYVIEWHNDQYQFKQNGSTSDTALHKRKAVLLDLFWLQVYTCRSNVKAVGYFFCKLATAMGRVRTDVRKIMLKRKLNVNYITTYALTYGKNNNFILIKHEISKITTEGIFACKQTRKCGFQFRKIRSIPFTENLTM